MSLKKRSQLCGLAEPYLTREPLFIRFCAAVVDNLATILRVALVVGAAFLVRDLREYMDKPVVPAAEVEPVVAEIVTQPVAPYHKGDSALTPGVVHAMNCTFEAYRNEHFDDCVEEPSEVYSRPGAGPDDAGFVISDFDTVHASAINITPSR